MNSKRSVASGAMRLLFVKISLKIERYTRWFEIFVVTWANDGLSSLDLLPKFYAPHTRSSSSWTDSSGEKIGHVDDPDLLMGMEYYISHLAPHSVNPIPEIY